MKVYEALGKLFVKEGVTTIFGLMGDGNMYWWSALEREPDVTLYEARHEGAALTMAEGYARVSGEPGVCAVTMGPGLSQLATALLVASRGGFPVVVFAGAAAPGDLTAGQYLDQERFAAATEAGFVGIWSADGVDEAVRQAFYRARLESRPVILNVPLNLQTREYEGDGDDYRPSMTLLPARQRLQPDPERLEDAARIIAESRGPVIVAGRGAIASGAGEAVQRLAERVGALLATTLPAKGWLGDSEYHAGISGLFSTRTAIELFAEADCAIGVGASLNHYTIEGGYLYPNARFIQIDSKPHVVMGNGRGADCYLQGDARLTLEALGDLLARQGVTGTGFHTARVRTALRESDPDPAEFALEPDTLDPRRVAVVLDERLPSEVGLLIGGAHYWSFPIFHMQRPRSRLLFTGAFGCIGQAIPTAIGAAVASGEPLVAMEGDGGAMMHIQELDTAARAGLKLLVVVMNDQALGAEYHKLRAKGMDPEPSTISTPDLGEVARAFRCRGRKVTTLDELAAGIDEFLAGDGPMLLDVRNSRTVVSIPYRRLHFGEDV